MAVYIAATTTPESCHHAAQAKMASNNTAEPPVCHHTTRGGIRMEACMGPPDAVRHYHRCTHATAARHSSALLLQVPAKLRPPPPCPSSRAPQATASTTRQAAAAAISKPPLDPCIDHRSNLEDVGSGGGINVGAPDPWLMEHDDLAFVFLAGDSLGSRSTPWGVGSALQDGEADAGPGGGTIPPQSCAQIENTPPLPSSRPPTSSGCRSKEKG